MSSTIPIIFMTITAVFSIAILFIRNPVANLTVTTLTTVFAIISTVLLYATGALWPIIVFWGAISLMWTIGTIYKATKI